MDTPSTLLSLSLEEHKGGSGVHASIYIHSLFGAQHIFHIIKIFLSDTELVVDIRVWFTVYPLAIIYLIASSLG